MNSVEGLMEDEKSWEKLLHFLHEKNLFEQGMYILWEIWNNRNECHHNLKCRSSFYVKKMAINKAREFHDVNQSDSLMISESRTEWKAPPRGSYKINVDAAYNSTSQVACLGAVARDSQASIIFSAVSKVAGIDSSLQAEALGILFGLQIGNELNFHNVILESDCLIMVNEIAKKQDSFCEWASILQDIQDLSLEFSSCSFRHVNREVNELAHSIARVPCDIGDRKIWRRILSPHLCNYDLISIQ